MNGSIPLLHLMTTMAKERTPAIVTDVIPSPCYVLEEQLLENNLLLLQQVGELSGATILCALKGFAMWSTFPILRKYLSGATASSLHEARLCFEEMKTKAHLCAPVYIDEEFDEIASISSHITFNSFAQYHRFRDRSKEHGLEMAIRINPEYSEVGTALYNPCTPGSRLGVTAAEFQDVLPDDIAGLHFHALCEQNADALENTLKAVETKFGKHLTKLRWINMGGGHHITRDDYDIDHLIRIINDFRQKYDLDVYLEPGEAIGWQTGYLVATVQDIVLANGLFNCHVGCIVFCPHAGLP